MYCCSDTYDALEQEKKKLERKRARNRLAATKCRQRKLQKINDLEKQVMLYGDPHFSRGFYIELRSFYLFILPVFELVYYMRSFWLSIFELAHMALARLSQNCGNSITAKFTIL